MKIEWISVKDELPKNSNQKNILVTLARNNVKFVMITNYYDGFNCWRNMNGKIRKEQELKDVTAWMPLPEPYEEV